MKKQEKIFTVQNLVAKLKEAKTIVLADYRGLTADQMQQLRTMIRKAGGEVIVVKNTLLKRALEESSLPVPDLEGPTAMTLALEDEIEPIRILGGYQKNLGLLNFKAGVWEDRLLTREELEELGQLPSKNQLFAKLAGLLHSPSLRLINFLSGNQKKLILILKTKARGGDN